MVTQMIVLWLIAFVLWIITLKNAATSYSNDTSLCCFFWGPFAGVAGLLVGLGIFLDTYKTNPLHSLTSFITWSLLSGRVALALVGVVFLLERCYVFFIENFNLHNNYHFPGDQPRFSFSSFTSIAQVVGFIASIIGIASFYIEFFHKSK